jgi:hypothetical protein
VIFWQDSTMQEGACHEEKALFGRADHCRREAE